MGGRLTKGLLPALAAVCAAGGLLACGGGSSNTTTVTSNAVAAAPTTTATAATTASTPAATASTPTTPTTSTQSAPSHPATQPSTTHVSAAASKFIVKGGDNSIPEYGQEAAAAERARAQAALTTFLHARAHDEWSRVCTELTAPTREQMEGLLRNVKAKGKLRALHGCAGVLAALSGGAAGRTTPQLTSVASLRVKGDVAFALFYGPHDVKYVMPMRNEGGAWKVDQLTPLPYPLGTPGVAP
jgi:hypothetical protein